MPLLKIQKSSMHLPFQLVLETPSPFQIGVYGKKENKIDYASRDGSLSINEMLRQKEQQVMQKLLPEKRVIILNQLHGDKVWEVNKNNYQKKARKNAGIFAEGDAIYTDDLDFALVIVTADCLPIFFIDKKNRTIGACHAGWKGTKKGIAKKTLILLSKKHNIAPRDIIVYILPGISQKAYEVQKDIAGYFSKFVEQKNGRLYLDLIEANIHLLKQMGIPGENFFLSPYCTLKHNDRFFSHRGGDKGRNLNVIWRACNSSQGSGLRFSDP